MKTILFFHREELTNLYIGIIQNNHNRFNIINVAYSLKERIMLLKYGIVADFVYINLLVDEISKINEPDLQLISIIDTFIIDNTAGRFTLNGSLQSDRGFSLLNYVETLKLAQANYILWKKIFDKSHVDLFVHEPVSLFFNHIACLLCHAQGGIYLSQTIAIGDTDEMSYMYCTHDDGSFPEIEQRLSFYKTNSDKVEMERCDKFLRRFRQNYENLASNLQPKINLVNFWMKSQKRKLSRFLNRHKFDRITENIDHWLNLQNPMGNRLINLYKYQYHKIKFNTPVSGEKYYYYSMHLEPEAVVLYLGSGLYTNQIKLIENIAASLPAGFYLYVKDHPHDYAYRRVDDYLRLMKVPNIRLLRSTIPGKEIIKDAIGIFTINGTAGFEGMMLGKQVYCFGKSYYTSSDRVTYIHDIRDLRKVIYENQNKEYKDDIELMVFVNAYLDSLHKGMIDFFSGRSDTYGVDLVQNAHKISEDLFCFVETFCGKLE